MLANAPVWLAQLVDEIERLRALVASKTMATFEWALEQRSMRAERDAALAEVERLRNVTDRLHNEALAKWATVEAERDAFRDECERLRNEQSGLRQELAQSLRREFNTALAEQAWRACADQLVACFDFAAEAPEALAVYEQLKGDTP